MPVCIQCEGYDFQPLALALEGEFSSDCPLLMEIVFADGEEIKELNARFRSVDKTTDVLSFPTLSLSAGAAIKKADYPYDIDEDGRLFIGSVVICEQVARAQAEEYGHSYLRELFYLAAHGACHLLGYDHEEESERAAMREKEERIMKKLNLARDI